MCDQPTVIKSQVIECAMCRKSVHFWCAESGSLNETALKIIKTKPSVVFVCKKCSPTGIKGGIAPVDGQEDHSRDGEINELKTQMQTIIKENNIFRKELDFTKQRNTQLLQEVTKFGEYMQAQTEKMELISNKNIELAELNRKLATTSIEQDKEIMTLLNTAANPHKRPRNDETDIHPLPDRERSQSENRAQTNRDNFDSINMLLQKALAPIQNEIANIKNHMYNNLPTNNLSTQNQRSNSRPPRPNSRPPTGKLTINKVVPTKTVLNTKTFAEVVGSF